jgi:protein-disulfide isomerase
MDYMRILALVLLLGASLYAKGAPSIRKPALEAWARYLFLWTDPVEVTVSDPAPSAVPGFYDVTVTARAGDASQQEVLMVSADGRKIIRGTAYELGQSPFAEDLRRIDTANAPALGPNDAPVKLVVFSDFQCSFCKRAAQDLRDEVLPGFGKNVQLIFMDYPLDQIHPWAREASIAGRCVQKQNPEAFWTYHDWVFAAQQELTKENLREKIAEFAKANSLDLGAIQACMAEPAVAAAVQASVTQAQTLALNSTPTLFVNGRRVVGAVPPAQLKAIIQHEIEHATPKAAGTPQ